MTKTSKIIKCVFTNTSPAPDGKPIYYFSMQFENGDVGYCGRMLREPQDMKEGQNMEYEIIGTKIKYIKPQQQFSNAQSSERKKTTYKKAPDDFLGYAYAYAKDLVVAGKTKPKDIIDLKEIAEIIYSHVTTLLTEGAKVNPTQESQEKKAVTKTAIEK